MAEKVEIKAEKREEFGRKNKKLRSRGLVPAVIYGRKFKSTPVALDIKEFKKKVLLSEAGHNLIFTLKVGKEGIPVMTYGVQRNPLTDEIIHIDFKHVLMDEQIKAKVPVELIGVPTGVKEDGGVLIHGLREVEIKCLPSEIPDEFEIDVSGLKINDSLLVSDLKIPKKIEILSSVNEMVANVSPPTKEEEVAPPAPTPEEAAAAEAAPAVAEEEVKEKTAPGAAPGKPAAAPGKPAAAAGVPAGKAAKPEKAAEEGKK